MSDSTFPFVYHGQVIAAGAVLPAVGIICVTLRFIARTEGKNAIGVDDWTALAAVTFTTGMGICLLIGASKGVMGYPSPPSPPDPKLQPVLYLPGQGLLEKLEYAFYIMMIMAYGFTKLSVIFFYRRIFVTSRNTFDLISKIAAVLAVIWTLGFVLVQIFACGSHFEYAWGPLIDQSYCHGGLPFLEALMISDFVSDFLIFFLPFPLIWKLHMPTKNKAIVAGILLLGSASLAASAARLVLQIQQSEGGYTTKTDIFLTITVILWWSMVEAGIATIAISLPALRNLLGGRSVRSIVASVRSAVSLTSITSRSSNQSITASQNNDKPYTGYQAHSASIVEAKPKDEPHPSGLLPNKIYVENLVSVANDTV